MEPLALPTGDEVVRGWWALPLGCLLPLSSGETYRLHFPGRSGGSAGPDVRDAVFYRVPDRAGELCEAAPATSIQTNLLVM